MFVAIRHDAQEAVGPFFDETEGVNWSKARREQSGDKFYVRPVLQEWSSL